MGFLVKSKSSMEIVGQHKWAIAQPAFSAIMYDYRLNRDEIRIE